jgi:hypothetical protein
MPRQSFVFPNVYKTRGKFSDRCDNAREQECSFVEIPAHFIRSKKDLKASGQEIYSIPTKETIRELYRDPIPVVDPLPHILHTEPIITRRSEQGRGKKPKLLWGDPHWRRDLINMLCDISEVMGCPAAKIEIHPGERKEVGLNNILDGVSDILQIYSKVTGCEPEILLENRTSQRVRNGQDIADLYFLCEEEYSHFQNKFGIVLDVSQLYSETREGFLASFALIPNATLKGFHIHANNHQVPSMDNAIPWREVFGRIRQIRHDVIINPEVLREGDVKTTIDFCKDQLKSHQN